MGDKTGIEWTDATWNPIRAREVATGKIGSHCEHVSEACRFCYAERFNLTRFGTHRPYTPDEINSGRVEVYLDEKVLLQPLRWSRARRIFPCSMTDLFGRFVKDEWLDKIFAVMALCPQHTFQPLTKRPERMQQYLTSRNGMGNAQLCQAINWIPRSLGNRHGALEMPLPNVWLGTTVEDQAAADQRIPLLLNTPAAKRFISAEPLLGSLNLTDIECRQGDATMNALTSPTWADEIAQWSGTSEDWKDEFLDWFGLLEMPSSGNMYRVLDWVICGGESGPEARPMHPDWARALRDQCAAAGVPFFFKQWGEWAPDSIAGPMLKWHKDLDISSEEQHGWAYDEATDSWRIGKKRVGSLLDGIEHKAFPA